METCRICLENDSEKNMISPCLCSGSQKFVHEKCVKKWLDAQLKNSLNYPEIYEIDKIGICNVCKSQYETSAIPRYWKFYKMSSPIIAFIQRNQFTFIFLLIILVIFSGILLIPFVINLLGILSVICYAFYYKGIRPKVIVTANGFRLAFIRVGPAVEGLRAGVLIQSTEHIDQGIFSESIILITAYHIEQGAVGFIVNKRINSPIADCIGGPVSPSSRHLIHACENLPDSQKVAEGVFVGGRASLLPEEACRILCLGYCGWAPNQLDGEVRAGYWRIRGQVRPEDLFY